MKFLVAADDGTLRCMPISRNTSNHSLIIPDIVATKDCNASDKAAPLPTSTTIYKSTSKSTIQCMTQLRFPSPSRGDVDAVAIAHRDGLVSVLDTENGEVLATIPASTNVAIDYKNTAHEENLFVSIEYRHDHLATCTTSGQARFIKVSSLWDDNGHEIAEFELPAPISVMRMHPTIPGIIAFGGKENDLQIWCSWRSFTREEKRDSTSDSGEEDDDDEKLWESLKPIWKAKNVKNDDLDLRVPVWISDLAFLPTVDAPPATAKDLNLVTSTRFRQLRLYNTRKARRPIKSIELSDCPISQIVLTSPSSQPDAPIELIFSDSVANVMHVNLSTSQVIGSYKGFSGSINSLSVSQDLNVVVAGGMDAYLRAFDVRTHQQLCSIYIGARITGVQVLPEPVEIKEEELDDERDEEDEVWEMMQDAEQEEGNGHERNRKRSRRS